MRVANTSSTAGASGGDICGDARRLRELSDVQISDNEMPARINTRQISVERRNVNRTVSNNNAYPNQVVEATTMIRESRDWERNVGRLTGEIKDGVEPNFVCGEWR